MGSLIIRFWLAALVLSIEPVIPAESGRSSHIDWTNPDEYTATDLGVEIRGVRVRIVAPAEAFADGLLTVKVELSTPAPATCLSQLFYLKRIDSVWGPVRSVCGTADFDDSLHAIVSFPLDSLRPLPTGYQRFAVVYQRQETPDASLWTDSPVFRVLVMAPLEVKRRLVLIMPKRYGVLDECHVGFDFRTLDTVVAFASASACISSSIGNGVEVVGHPVNMIGDTIRIEGTEEMRPLSPRPGLLHVGKNNLELFIEIHEECWHMFEGKRIWSRRFELHLNPTELTALERCQKK